MIMRVRLYRIYSSLASGKRRAGNDDDDDDDDDKPKKKSSKAADDEDAVKIVKDDFEDIDRANIIPGKRPARRAALNSGLARPKSAGSSSSATRGSVLGKNAFDDEDDEAEF